MKNQKLFFKVTTNRNIYYATSLKKAERFCKKNDFVIINYWNASPTLAEKKSAKKCGWGVYCILDNN
jgi:hypothetical protein